ncbi:MAG: phenylalanine--tRNA ligase subunit beta [Candidatus Saccharimonas sp.]
MKVSLNTVKQYIDKSLPAVDELVKRINEQLGGVEEVMDLAVKYDDAVIVRVIEATQHPNADRLRVCRVDDGGVVSDVPRDDDGYVQVVCGAPNAREGILAVWLPPKSTVPSSFDDAEPLVLDARELRGVLSQGMLAAGDELAINNDHDGIVEINLGEWKPTDVAIEPGASFAKAFGLDDTIIDIENKMFTHRPDCFGQLGVAREIAGILGHKFTSPTWYLDVPGFANAEGLNLEVFNDANDKVPRIMFVAMQNIEVKPSPLWLQCALVAMGGKPINNVVDVTNYVMLLTAQPTHAYDYDKIRGTKIGARMAKAGEQVSLLNGKTYELTTDDIVIADGEGPVGLAGIMGGGDSEVDANTKNIVLEVASFDMYAVRKSSMRHGIFTDALTRFNKGQSPLQNDHILSLLMTSMKDVSPATQASDVFDLGSPALPGAVRVTDTFINERLGLQLQNTDITTLLSNVEFHVASPDDHDTYLEVFPPFWRTDVQLPEDVVEEVGRLYGFDKLPRELPTRSIRPAEANDRLTAKCRIRNVLSRAGANEVLTYSFVHANVMTRAAQDPQQAFQLSNALSPELQYYRISVLPSLLAHVHANIKSGHDEFVLYELGKGHHVDMLDDDGLPIEFDRVAGVYAAKRAPNGVGSAYYAARRYVDELLRSIHASNVQFQKLSTFDYGEHQALMQLSAPFEPERSAMVMINDRFAGVVGEIKSSVRSGFKLPEYAAAFELFLSPFVGVSTDSHYRPLSRYPSVTQDISLRATNTVSYESVAAIVHDQTAKSAFQVDVSPLAIYRPEGESATTYSFRLKVASHDRTLRDDEVTTLLDQVAAAAKQTVAVERV